VRSDAGAHGARTENGYFMDTLHECEPQRLKPPVLLVRNGMAEAMPF
jgi:hypothetical protein